MASKENELFPYFINSKKLNIIDDKKYCSTCNNWLTLDCFEVNKSKYLGYNYWCSNCLSLVNEGKIVNYYNYIRNNINYNKSEEVIQHLNKFDPSLNTTDHIIPISFFNFKNEDSIKYANDYRNLVKLSMNDNIKKSNKITIDFVPYWHLSSFKEYVEEIRDKNVLKDSIIESYLSLFK